jgi:signal transduction histidine kinase
MLRSATRTAQRTALPANSGTAANLNMDNLVAFAHLYSVSSKRRRKIIMKFVFVISTAFYLALLCVGNQNSGFAQEVKQQLGVTQLLVDGRTIKLSRDGINRLPSESRAIAFTCGSMGGNDSRKIPLRFRFKLMDYDSDWREVPAQMWINFIFLDEEGNEVSKKEIPVSGQSKGWTGNFQTSPLEHREKTFEAPPKAHKLLISIISAGSPQNLGTIAVSDLVVRTPKETNSPELTLLDLNADSLGKLNTEWMKDGSQFKMAHTVEIGSSPRRHALVIIDDDPNGHAMWHTVKAKTSVIVPGQKFVAEWNQMFSIGMGAPSTIAYDDLPPGHYRFALERLTMIGVPTGELSFCEFEVPMPFWKTRWFWGVVFFSVLAGFFLRQQYRVKRRLQAENLEFAQQQILERERIRIAQDIHDDLGAQVAQISLVSAMAEGSVAADPVSKQTFQQITELSRKLVGSLYATVWVVNPENDNLEAVGSYLCQIFNQMISQADLDCWMEVPTLPSDLPISSHQRHNLAMAVKEATNNIIKHAGATEARMSINLENSTLNISIKDNGVGFNPESIKPGNGMGNLISRLEGIGGSAAVKSRPGAGTQVHLQMPIGHENFDRQ